jgi:adenylate cyclase
MRFCGHCGAPAAASTAGASTAAAPAAASSTPVHAPTPEQLTDVGGDILRAFVTGQVADRLVETGGQLAEERRLVTALFADLSGFTLLSERLDSEALLDVIDPIISGLSEIVGRYEGFVEKFAGDALLALFGAPVAHEDDALRAMLVAEEMHATLARMRAELGPDASELTLHIGINTGHGVARMIGSKVRMDYAVLGDAVILAQRLEAAAPPGETYVGASTQRLVAGRAALEPVGPLTLKGKAEPVPAWRLLSVASWSSSIAAGEPLIGRERELAALLAALATPKAAATIVGEPGVGKTRLVTEARAATERDSVRWLVARCVSYGAGLPYWPVADLLRRWAAIPREDEPAEARGRFDAACARLDADLDLAPLARVAGLPVQEDEAADLASMAADGLRRRLQVAVARWLGAQASAGSVVLLVEDVHWADASTLELLDALAHDAEAARVSVVATARPEAGELPAALASSLRLDLGPLDAAAMDELLRGLLSAIPPRELANAIAERSGGNPFFAREIVLGLIEAGTFRRDGPTWRLPPHWSPDEVPNTVEGVLAARLDRLPPNAAAVLGAASVIGRRVPLALLEHVSDGDIMPSVAVLLAAGMLERPLSAQTDTVIFRHALTQEVAYGRLLRRQRRDLHRRTGEAARTLYGEGDDVVDLLARHFYFGEAGSLAIDYLTRAGIKARALFANDAAIWNLERAAEVAARSEPPDPRLAKTLLMLADSREVVGDYPGAHAAYRQARDAGGGVVAWAGMASTLRRQGRYDEVLDVLNGAFAAGAEGDSGPLWLERGWTLSMAGRLDDAIEAFRSGLRGASFSDGISAQVLVQLARTEGLADRYLDARDHANQALAIFEQAGDQRGMATALRVLGHVQNELGDLDAAAASLRRAIALAERTGSVEEIAGSLINLGLVDLARGATDDAIADDRRAIEEFERIGHGSGRATGYANLAEKLMVAGRLEEALAECLKAIELGRSIGHVMTVADGTQTLAMIRQRLGDHAEAARLAEEAATAYVEMNADQYAPGALELAVEAWRQAGDEERAAAAQARLDVAGSGDQPKGLPGELVS